MALGRVLREGQVGLINIGGFPRCISPLRSVKMLPYESHRVLKRSLGEAKEQDHHIFAFPSPVFLFIPLSLCSIICFSLLLSCSPSLLLPSSLLTYHPLFSLFCIPLLLLASVFTELTFINSGLKFSQVEWFTHPPKHGKPSSQHLKSF